MKTSFFLLLILCICFSACDSDSKSQFDHTRKVLIIGIDGVRSDMIEPEFAPNLFAFSELSNTYFNPEHKTEPITWSATNWSSICTGVHVNKHKAYDNLFIGSKFNQYPHFFSYINEVDENDELELVSVVHWLPINLLMAANHADYATSSTVTDISVRNIALKLLNEDKPKNPDVLFLHFDDVDHAGHGFAFSTTEPRYVAEMQRIDGYVGEVLEALENRQERTGEEWLVMVVSDHGGTGNSHDQGSGNAEVGNTIFFMNHSDINSIYTVSGSRMVDLAPTVLQYLNVYSEKAQAAMDGVPLAF